MAEGPGAVIPAQTKKTVTDNLKRVQDRIAEAAGRSKRTADDITLVAVTKTVELPVIRLLIEQGMRHFGENRVQQMVQRAAIMHEQYERRRTLGEGQSAPDDICWHMIGHLQRNKVGMMLPWIHMVHSVDSLRLAEEIAERGKKLGLPPIQILIQVNITEEPQKYGIPPAAALYLVEQLTTVEGITVVGLMAMGEATDDPETCRPYFARMYELFEEIRYEGVAGPHFRHLSMGMTQDYTIAIEEGATMVRVGSALFESEAE